MILNITDGIFNSTEDIWLTDLIGSIIGGVLFLVVSFIAASMAFKKKSKTLVFFFLTWLFVALYLLVEAVARALYDPGLSPLLYKLSYSIFLPFCFIFWVLFLDYAQSDQIGWKKMALGIGVAVALFTWVWHPTNDVSFQILPGPTYKLIVPNYFAFWFIYNSIYVLLGVTGFYWTFTTLRKAPPELEEEAKRLNIGGIMLLLVPVLILLGELLPLLDQGSQDLRDIGDIMVIGALVLLVVGALISTVVITKEPKMTHILPYTVYRLLITNKTGTPYYDRSWSEHEINSIMVSGLLSAIGSFANETLKDVQAGSISEIRMRKGVLLTEMQYSPINIALLASKSSKDLRTGLENFGSEFTKKYYNHLYNEDGFPKNIPVPQIQEIFSEKEVEPLIRTHFSNIPSFIRQGVTTEELIDLAEKGEIKDAHPDAVENKE